MGILSAAGLHHNWPVCTQSPRQQAGANLTAVGLVAEQTRPDQVIQWYHRFMMVRNISQAKAQLSALIEQVQMGREVILAKAGKPVARLVAYRGPSRPRKPGSMEGQIWMAPDFDTLPPDMAEAFGMVEHQS